MSEMKSTIVEFPPLYRAVSETAAFSSDVQKYLTEKQAAEGQVFGGRIMNWKIIFASTYDAVDTVLKNPAVFKSKQAYGLFKGLSLFGPNVAFSDDEEHSRLKKLLMNETYSTLGKLSKGGYIEQIKKVVDLLCNRLKKKIERNNGMVEVNVYDVMKRLCVEVLAMVFLDYQIDEKLYEGADENDDATLSVVKNGGHFQKLQSVFWQATTSTGLKFNVSAFGIGLKSAFAKGEKAGETIRKILAGGNLKKHEASNPPATTEHALTDKEKVQHYLLFSSSMVSKTMASLLTSYFLVATEHPELPKKVLLDNPMLIKAIIQELQRMYPAIIGCCRYTTKAIQFESDGLKYSTRTVKQDNYVWCSFLTAHRDPKYFPEPDVFTPERWLAEDGTMNTAMKDIFSFGAYSKACLGKDLVEIIITEVISRFTKTFAWEKLPGQKLSYRWLPVSRPVSGLNVKLVLRKP